MYKLFVELIQVALGKGTSLSVDPTAEEWRLLFELARKQTLVGVCFAGVERLPAEQRPPREVLMQWYGLTRQIEERNKVMDARTEEATRFFRSHGFRTWVLKGQGMARLYPWPERRQSGDIDIWLVPDEDERVKIKDDRGSAREAIYEFARAHDPEGRLHGVNYHHVHYHLFDDVEVEAHIFPSYMNNPFHNRNLQRFFQENLPTEATTPTTAFNRVFILSHCFDHFLGHGVGLRQVMDYYFVLRTQDGELRRSRSARRDALPAEDDKLGDDIELANTLRWLKKLGLMRFAGAMMWVMREAFGLEQEYMLVEPDEKEGRFLLEEIFQTGNMGHHEQRNWGSLKTPASRFLYNLRRDWHFLSHYPQEVCWQPFFSIWMNIRRVFWTKKK